MSETDYDAFLESKKIHSQDSGFDVDLSAYSFLYPFQSMILEWAIKKGRSAIFADCGLGKTPIQLSWADAVCKNTGGRVLIVAPLAVSKQTRREGDKFGIHVNICRSQDEVTDGINIANYEMLEHFDASQYSGIVLDESSILKGFGGVVRKQITGFAQQIRYRLACTATPAPNDLIEITNHAEFLSVLTGKEIIALFFKQDGNTTHAWRLKGHARVEFWKWMATWALAVRSPYDLGFDDDRFVLPSLDMVHHETCGHITEGWLFPIEAATLQDRNQARRESIDQRVSVCAELANGNKEQWLIWCGLNKESDALKHAIPDSIEVKGSDSQEHKEDALIGFSECRYRVLITKPSIAGFGMNFQCCHNMAFVGLSDSWEQYYQAIRRCWRFGQKHTVTAHIVAAETEGAVVNNIRRKELQAIEMMSQMVSNIGSKYLHQKDDDRYEGTIAPKLPAFMKGN